MTTTTMNKRNPLIAAFILVTLVFSAILSIGLVRAPEPLSADAPAAEFSAARAMAHVRAAAREPHAMGTVAHTQVREYLVGQLRGLGLQTEVQEATAQGGFGGGTQVGYVYNVLGRLKGSSSGKAVLLMAHYDSQPNTPGAGDDAAGVAAIVETVRALQQGEPLQNDIIVALTDGEEYGLYGAKAFLKHPWAREVGFVINVEGRGNSGASMTFEISPENGWVVEQFASAAPYPFASSLAYEVYRVMPNDTDFTVMRDEGFSGVNSAFVDGFVHYHKMTDTPENLSQNSLQHHGSNMLALARHFGNLNLEGTKAPDKVFFNPLGSWLVQYPAGLNMLWAGLVALLLVVTFIVGAKKQALTVPQVVAGFFLFLLILAVVTGSFIPINSLVKSALPYTHDHNGVYGSDNFFVAYVLLALGLVLLLGWLALRWLKLFSLVMGVYVLWAMLALAVLFTVPAAAYVLLFPLLSALAGTLLVLLSKASLQQVNWRYAVMLLLGVLPAIFMLMPIVQLLSVVFALQLPAAFVALFVLLSGLLLPLLAVLEHSFRWRKVPLLPLLLLLAGGLQTASAVAAEAPSEKQPLHSHVSYYLNADTDEALWASAFERTDDWNRQFFPTPVTGALTEVYPFATRSYLKGKADPLPLQAPSAALVSDRTAGNERILELKLSSPRGAAHLELMLQPHQADTLGTLVLQGEVLPLTPIKTESGLVYFTRLHGLPVSKEVNLQVRLQAGSALRLLLYDQSIGLPPEAVQVQMPAHVIPEQGRESNLTVVRKEYRF